jgi:hypothetical protein
MAPVAPNVARERLQIRLNRGADFWRVRFELGETRATGGDFKPIGPV